MSTPRASPASSSFAFARRSRETRGRSRARGHFDCSARPLAPVTASSRRSFGGPSSGRTCRPRSRRQRAMDRRRAASRALFHGRVGSRHQVLLNLVGSGKGPIRNPAGTRAGRFRRPPPSDGRPDVRLGRVGLRRRDDRLVVRSLATLQLMPNVPRARRRCRFLTSGPRHARAPEQREFRGRSEGCREPQSGA
jgi:hypothetical protein